MTSLHQLIRRPFKTFLGILLVIISCMLSCISLGQYYASVLTQRRVEAEYTTIALPTDKFQKQVLMDEQGKITGTTYLSEQPWEIQSLLMDLTERFPQTVKAAEQHNFISGYCRDMELLNYTRTFPQSYGDGLTAIRTVPYTCAMFEILVNEVSEVAPLLNESELWPGAKLEDYGVAAEVSGTVLGVYALQQGYENPTGRTIYLKLRTESEESFSELGIETGKRYLVYGTDYQDLNWELKSNIAMGDQKIFDNICWDNIVYLTEEEKRTINGDNSLFGRTEDDVALYVTDIIDGARQGLYLTESDLGRVNSCSMTVCANPNVLNGQLTHEEVSVYSEGEISMITPQEYDERYRRAGIVRLNAPATDFLEASDHQIWQTALREAEINNHAFPVIATDNLQSIAQFGAQEALISDGRRFTAEEYEQGRPVCIISESLAVLNGLGIGDSISLQYYEFDIDEPDESILRMANPSAHFYSRYVGFCSEETDYEIVGLYRQKQEWTTDEYSFTPNTVFVPKNSVCGQTETRFGGIFRTFVLKNGTVQWLEDELTALGYDGLLIYYDQGYSDIAASLSEYFAVAKKILLAGLAGWCILIAVFLFMFPGRQKQAVERMWTLGAPRSWVVKHILVSGMGIVIPGVVLGGVASACLMRSLLEKAGEYAGISLEQPAGLPVMAAGLALVQLAVLTGLTAVAAGRITHSIYDNKPG